MRGLPSTGDANVLVGFGTSDDAGVYKLRDDLALVQTLDFFTPIVDDPYEFGRIAAANALSDVYAMGAKPITALNIVAYPYERLGPEILARILAGGAATAIEAGVALLGGHTIEDDEPKYGMSVTGLVDPGAIVTNAGAKPGDVLVLTKPLGTGVLGTALKKDAIGDAEMAEAIAWMTTLNAAACEAMIGARAHAATDVTGFGLLGHANEMARASGVGVRFQASEIPVYSLALDLIDRGISPAGSRSNADQHATFTTFAQGVSPALRLLLSDAQTSGGLLIAVPPDRLDALLAGLHEPEALRAVIGRIEAGAGIFIDE